MQEGKEIHWFVNSDCNLDCPGCFRDLGAPAAINYSLESLATAIIDAGVKKVTIGGGEPMLVRDLEKVFKILKEGKVETRLHTNGMLLSQQRLDDLAPFVDYIALPIDSLDEKTQAIIRGQRFIPTLKRMEQLSRQVKDRGITLGCHTVFTSINYGQMSDLYDFIADNGFDFWRVFEFNENLARRRFFDKAKNHRHNYSNSYLKEEWRQIDLLVGDRDHKNGGVNCLGAKFILEEANAKYQAYKPQTRFVGVRDPKPPYAFLYNSGEVRLFTWFSDTEREPIGNIFTSDYGKMVRKLETARDGPWDERSSEDFVSAEAETPLWKRMGNGLFEDCEFAGIGPRRGKRIEELAGKYEDRMERIWKEYQQI